MCTRCEKYFFVTNEYGLLHLSVWPLLSHSSCLIFLPVLFLRDSYSSTKLKCMREFYQPEGVIRKNGGDLPRDYNTCR